MDLNQFSFVRLTLDHKIKYFDCNDNDLNDFLLNDSINYTKNLLTVTYLIENGNQTVAFFSVLNDKISIDDAPSKNFWRSKISSLVPHPKRFPSYPAVKIARLGVDKSFQSHGLGTTILDYIKMLFINNNRTGCKFITVDAYNNEKTLNFYLKNGFNFLLKKDEKNDYKLNRTKLMYFDLSLLQESL